MSFQYDKDYLEPTDKPINPSEIIGQDVYTKENVYFMDEYIRLNDGSLLLKANVRDYVSDYIKSLTQEEMIETLEEYMCNYPELIF